MRIFYVWQPYAFHNGTDLDAAGTDLLYLGLSVVWLMVFTIVVDTLRNSPKFQGGTWLVCIFNCSFVYIPSQRTLHELCTLATYSLLEPQVCLPITFCNYQLLVFFLCTRVSVGDVPRVGCAGLRVPRWSSVVHSRRDAVLPGSELDALVGDVEV